VMEQKRLAAEDVKAVVEKENTPKLVIAPEGALKNIPEPKKQ